MTVMSVSTLVLACLQIFLQDASRAERYRRTGARYAAVKRDFELLVSQLSTNGRVDESKLNAAKHRLDELADEALAVPGPVWRSVEKGIRADKVSFNVD